MRVTNYFVLGKRLDVTFSNDISIDSETGAITSVSGDDSCTDFISLDRPSCCIKIGDHIEFPGGATVFAYLYDMSKNLISSEEVSNGSRIGGPGTSFMYVAFRLADTTYSSTIEGMLDMFRPCNPHYKDLYKKYKKESGEELFRISLDGKVSFFREDFDFINDAWIDEQFLLDVYQTVDGATSLYVSTMFLKTNCTLNLFARSAETKLKANDPYDTILGAYDNKYDLIKMKTPTTTYKFLKRAVYQAYVMGANVVTNCMGATCWDEEVEPVSSLPDLANKYHFSLGGAVAEVTINEPTANTPINAVYNASYNKSVWNSVHEWTSGGVTETVTTSIRFVKMGSIGDPSPYPPDTQNWYTISGNYVNVVSPQSTLIYDVYRIDLYLVNAGGTDTLLYSTATYYALDQYEGFLLGLHSDLKDAVGGLPMSSQIQGNTPAMFYLDSKVTYRYELGRIVCDSTKLVTDDGRPIYPMAYDDFASLGKNFRKVIPYAPVRYGNHTDSTLVISANGALSNEPTAYGKNDYGQYFAAPLIASDKENHWAVPLSKSTWINVSHWLAFNEDRYETYISQLYEEVQHTDAYDLHTVIQRLLTEIGSDVTFSNTTEYSRFFYDPDLSFLFAVKGARRLVLDPKSNVLTATYSEAAKKAEISLKQVMTMLKQVFKVYWFIDGQKRLHLEHVSYFKSGGTYDTPQAALDLTTHTDAHSKKNAIYAQSSISYDTSELVQRYEFEWGDTVTDAMGQGMSMDMKSLYAKDGSTETVTISYFNPDLDYMLFSPNEFNKDGFALLSVYNEDNTVHIGSFYIRDGTQIIRRKCYVNNSMMSLIVNSWLYEYDASALHIAWSFDYGGTRLCLGYKQFKKQTVRTQTESDPDPYGLVGTDAHYAPGRVGSLSVNISTRMTDISVDFEP